VSDVLEILLQRYGDTFHEAIFKPDGGLWIILLNGIDYIDGLESEITEQDILYLFPRWPEGELI